MIFDFGLSMISSLIPYLRTLPVQGRTPHIVLGASVECGGLPPLSPRGIIVRRELTKRCFQHQSGSSTAEPGVPPLPHSISAGGSKSNHEPRSSLGIDRTRAFDRPTNFLRPARHNGKA